MRPARVCWFAFENSPWFVELHKIFHFMKVQTNTAYVNGDTEKNTDQNDLLASSSMDSDTWKYRKMIPMMRMMENGTQ